MPRLPNQRRIYSNDFSPEYQELVSRIADTLNINLEVLFDALNNKISLSDNILCTVKTIEIEVNSSGNPVNSIAVELINNLQVKGVQVISANNLTNSNVYPLSQPFVSWSINQQGRLVVNNVTGLQANNKYRLNLIVWN